MPQRIVLYFLAILIGTWSADAAEIALRPQSHAQGSLVLLGDVAEVKSTDAPRSAGLERLELFPAPAPHRSKLMHVRELVELLVLHGVDISDIEFTGARTTRIHAPTQDAKVLPTGLPSPAVAPQEIVVARRALNRGDFVREADIELQPSDPKVRRSHLASQRELVVGMEVLSSIHEGEAIGMNQLRRPVLVKRGEVIRVRARAAGVQVTTTARATEQGSLGDIIMVQSLENREKYPTHVTGWQQVEVYATGVLAADPRQSAPQIHQATQRPNLFMESR